MVQFLKVTKDLQYSVYLFHEKDQNGTPLAPLDDEVAWIKLKSVSDDKTWNEVIVKLLFSEKTGWVLSEFLEPADAHERKPVVVWTFTKNCTSAARYVNALNKTDASGTPLPYGANRDYLLAWAYLETGKTETTPVSKIVFSNPAGDSDGDGPSGPFQLAKGDWAKFLEHGDTENIYNESDRADPVFQCLGAAWISFKAAETISNGLTENNADKSSGGYVPNSTELFLAHMANAESAIAMSKAKGSTTQAAKSLFEAALGSKKTALLYKKYKKFLGSSSSPKTVDAVFAVLEKKLNTALKKAFKLVEEHTPEDIIFEATGGTPPWMVKANEEFTKGIDEHNSAHKSIILDYFKTTSYHPANIEPWCGAFVSWCLAKSGNAIVQASVLNKGGARAASWKKWGDADIPIRAKNIPVGSVVVLSPAENSDSSGHVGFFVKKSSGKIHLLGGNQSDKVKVSKYNNSKIVKIKWLKWAGDIDNGAENPLVGAGWEKYIEVLGARESDNKYHAVNNYGYSGRWQFGALALIDLGYVKSGAKTKFLRKDNWWTGKDGISSRSDWLNNEAVQNAAMKKYTLSNYKSLLRIKAATLGIPEHRVAGLLAAAHLTGPGGALKMVKGIVTADGNGVTAHEYFKLMSEKFGGPTLP